MAQIEQQLNMLNLVCKPVWHASSIKKALRKNDFNNSILLLLTHDSTEMVFVFGKYFVLRLISRKTNQDEDTLTVPAMMGLLFMENAAPDPRTLNLQCSISFSN